ncbi:hypothetical protein BD324DRAFT_78979 [Kockovaella imperatae]|uniref:Wings apart-like protein C-terminal domain-containing protein n=1 Tax=Kockovaella imperatae TaxID=4999 RepID=A0A1Y1UFC1_9TREE|nr:hypothetical protein BD324DRAFT_78979 [Kockovaella imperatae]ORX35775.1 hypothetical protein BD324DRAFT_78979 [Kockovaella imperatae]
MSSLADSPSRARSSGGHQRMLTKTQSLGQVGSEMGFNLSPRFREVARTKSMPITPSKSTRDNFSPQLLSSPTAQAIHLGAQAAAESSQAGSGGAKRTYGLKRSIKSLDQPAAPSLAEDDTIPVTTSYANLRKKYEVQNEPAAADEFQLNALIELTARPPQAVADMRSKGENRRFIDEIDYLVENLFDERISRSIRIASSIEILRQMQDESWLSKALIYGQVERLWSPLWTARKEGDVVLDAVCTVFVTVLAISELSFDTFALAHSSSLLSLFLSVASRDPNQFMELASHLTVAELIASTSEKLGLQIQASELAPRQIACHLMIRLGIRLDNDSSLGIKTTQTLLHILKDCVERCHPKSGARFPNTTLLLSSEMSILNDCLQSLLTVVTHMSSCLEYILARAKKSARTICMILELSVEAIGSTEAAEEVVSHDLQLLALLVNSSSDWALAALDTTSASQTISRLIRSGTCQKQKETSSPTRAGVSASIDSATTSTDLRLLALVTLFGIIVHGPATAAETLAKTDSHCGSQKPRSQAKVDRLDQRLALLFAETFLSESIDEDDSRLVLGHMALLLIAFLSVDQSSRSRLMGLLPGSDEADKKEALRKSVSNMMGQRDDAGAELHQESVWTEYLVKLDSVLEHSS